ncbi:MAG: DNA-methyltransferase [Acidimicrobiales bacterium]
MGQRRRRSTATSNFGAGRREAHDASAFYARFAPPTITEAEDVAPPKPVDEPFVCGDARAMVELEDDSVALVVTSPPYFTGKQYEAELAAEGVPGSYLEYLQLLREVFAECVRVLEPGGRLAVNVANLGRKPYRSLAADVTTILQDDLGLLLRGEVVWRKAEGATGSCAWGSFRSPANPVLRDLTERVVIAGKGRFDRAVPTRRRASLGLPHESTVTTDEFLAATLDVWEIAPERATRVQHPAPFPVELPQRLIELYTYRDDLVLDPFMGSGSALVAAARTGRRYVGYDLDPGYVEIARRRVAEVGADPVELFERPIGPASLPTAKAAAEAALVGAGFAISGRDVRVRGLGLSVDLVVTDRTGGPWYIDVVGSFTTVPTGLSRSDSLWRAIGRASVLSTHGHSPYVVLTTDLPPRGSDGDKVMRAARPSPVFDVVLLGDESAMARLAGYVAGGRVPR